MKYKELFETRPEAVEEADREPGEARTQVLVEAQKMGLVEASERGPKIWCTSNDGDGSGA